MYYFPSRFLRNPDELKRIDTTRTDSSINKAKKAKVSEYEPINKMNITPDQTMESENTNTPEQKPNCMYCNQAFKQKNKLQKSCSRCPTWATHIFVKSYLQYCWHKTFY